jgi:hypothetical protein
MKLPGLAPLPAQRREGLWVEWSFAIITVCSVIYSAWFLWENNYLPAPFFYEPNDVFADWFNTAYWARDKGTYDVWTALYPPASFVFLRIFGLDRCYVVNRFVDTSLGYDSRDCDWVGLSTIAALYIIDVALIYITFRKRDRVTALPRTICLGLGWPLLDGVERGNLVLAAFMFLMLALGPLLRSTFARATFAGLAINFKVYLVAAFVPLLLRRKWRQGENALLGTILVYMFTYAMLGRGTPIEIFHNLAGWSSQTSGGGSPLDFWVATTYEAWLGLLKGDGFPTVLILGSHTVNTMIFVIPLMQNTVRALIAAAAAMVWLRPEAVPTSRVVNLGLMMAMVTSDSGGYTPVYYIYFVLMEPWKYWEQKVALFMCFLMAPSIDFPIDQLAPVIRDTYFRHSTTVVNFNLTVWPLIRPLVIQIVAVMISLRTIRQVWGDVQSQGWAGRWRFRGDAPILPDIARPRPFSQSARDDARGVSTLNPGDTPAE